MKKTAKTWNNSFKKVCTRVLVGVALVSFFTTYHGLKEFVFNEDWQALLISLAIQLILFGLNSKLVYYCEKYNAIFIIVLWILMLLASSIFSYVYIVNEIYTDEIYYGDAERTLDEEFIKKGYAYENYIDLCAKEVIKDLNVYTNKSVGDTDSELGVDTAYYIKSIESIVLSMSEEYRENVHVHTNEIDVILKALEQKYESEEIDSAIEKISTSIETLRSTKDNIKKDITDNDAKWKGVNKRLEQYSNFKDSEFLDLQKSNNERETKSINMNKDYNSVDNIIGIAESCIKDLANQKNLNKGNLMTDLKKQIRSEINKDSSETNNLNSLTDSMYELLIAQGLTDGSTEIEAFMEFKNMVMILGELKEGQRKIEVLLGGLDEQRKALSLGNKDEKLDFEYNNWKNGWQDKLNSLRDIVKGLPISAEIWVNNAPSTLKSLEINRINEIDSISKMERRYLVKLNKLEKSINLLFSKYKFMAIFSFIVAIFLDITGALAGAFLYVMSLKEGDKLQVKYEL